MCFVFTVFLRAHLLSSHLPPAICNRLSESLYRGKYIYYSSHGVKEHGLLLNADNFIFCWWFVQLSCGKHVRFILLTNIECLCLGYKVLVALWFIVHQGEWGGGGGVTCSSMVEEGNVLFNDALNTFYFTVIWRRTYGKGPFR